jgi:hypothetical protein
MCPAARQFHDLYPFQLNLPGATMFKYTKTTAQEHRHDIHMELIRETHLQTLSCRARRPDDVDILFSPASFAWWIALPKPSVTKVKVNASVSFGFFSGALCVRKPGRDATPLHFPRGH